MNLQSQAIERIIERRIELQLSEEILNSRQTIKNPSTSIILNDKSQTMDSYDNNISEEYDYNTETTICDNNDEHLDFLIDEFISEDNASFDNPSTNDQLESNLIDDEEYDFPPIDDSIVHNTCNSLDPQDNKFTAPLDELFYTTDDLIHDTRDDDNLPAKITNLSPNNNVQDRDNFNCCFDNILDKTLSSKDVSFSRPINLYILDAKDTIFKNEVSLQDVMNNTTDTTPSTTSSDTTFSDHYLKNTDCKYFLLSKNDPFPINEDLVYHNKETDGIFNNDVYDETQHFDPPDPQGDDFTSSLDVLVNEFYSFQLDLNFKIDKFTTNFMKFDETTIAISTSIDQLASKIYIENASESEDNNFLFLFESFPFASLDTTQSKTEILYSYCWKINEDDDSINILSSTNKTHHSFNTDLEHYEVLDNPVNRNNTIDPLFTIKLS